MNEKEIKAAVVLFMALFFAGVFYTVYQLLLLLRRQAVMKRAWEKSIKVLEEKNQTRKMLEKKSAGLYGETEKHSLPAKIDAILAYSGLYTRFPRLTAEKCMAALLSAGCMEIIMLGLFGCPLWKCLGITAITQLVVLEAVRLLRAVRKKQVENELLHCLDVMEMNAFTCTDIVEILRKTALKVKEPLRTELLGAVADAVGSGSSAQALKRLANRIENKYLKDMILNMEICSRYRANYGEVLQAGKRIFLQDAVNRERMKKLHRNTLMFTLALVLIGAACLQMMGGMMAEGGGNALTMLWNKGVAGQAVLVYLGCVTLGGIWSSFIKAF